METERRIRITKDTDIVAAREEGRTFGAALRFPSSDLTFLSVAISELARNILTYAGSGEIAISVERRNGRTGLSVVARDEGPGIDDIHLAMQDGYSTSGSLGLGLPGARRLMDDFDIWSEPGKGTVVTMRKWTR